MTIDILDGCDPTTPTAGCGCCIVLAVRQGADSVRKLGDYFEVMPDSDEFQAALAAALDAGEIRYTDGCCEGVAHYLSCELEVAR